MKFIVITFAALCAFVGALPGSDKIQLYDARIVTGAISSAIEDLSQSIRDAGLDPLHIVEKNFDYALPVPAIFSAEVTCKDVRSNGLSNIVIERLNFAILTQRLTMTLALPRVEASIGQASGAINSFGHNIAAEVSGTVAVTRVQLGMDVRVSVGIISGITIRSLSVDFSLAGIDSDLNVKVQDYDLSSSINTFIDTNIPAAISDNRAAINELLEYIAWQLIDEYFAHRSQRTQIGLSVQQDRSKAINLYKNESHRSCFCCAARQRIRSTPIISKTESYSSERPAHCSWSLPVPGIVSAEGYGQDVQLVGLSQIVINGVSYNMLSGRLDLDISLPSVYGAVGSCGGTVSVLEYTIDGQGSGEINAINSRVVGSAIVRIGFSGVTVTNVDVVASMENISSDITATILGQDVSAYFNAFFNEILLSYLNEFADEINELLSYYILVYINNRLP
ncbi:hypothetical protein K1T71_003502 [Dendrolimus kikuchii]|uniref:Uncharacterized protein n=1 Tax=Dendrolimus kikuchii TaxID=765133 RepID=A0ACC1DDB1_9NEOP|nr:hypothetical protein K1T71_003502 [Dendrolimus kikuchii]